MLPPVDFILGASGTGVTTVAIRITTKLTRLIVAIENLEKAARATSAKVDEHESRLNRAGLF
jgi:hypothetical protein